MADETAPGDGAGDGALVHCVVAPGFDFEF